MDVTRSFEKTHLIAGARAKMFGRRWHLLCERYMPVWSSDSIWRFNRDSRPREPSQGWKLHISATILDACDIFERVVPFLIAEDVQFKAPNSLDELSEINSGLKYGYHQVGKFITVYPLTKGQTVLLAEHLHELTEEFFAIAVPYDEQYLPESSIFYRYGAFTTIEAADDAGETFPAIMNPLGKLVLDDRRRAVPEWISSPFPNNGNPSMKTFDDTPLGTTYRIFSAMTQRGKGGAYEAVDLSQDKPRRCIVKEGRLNGDLGWNGQDGHSLVRNEFGVLSALKKIYDAVPQVFSSFEVYGNFYFAMEYVEGKNLREIMGPRQRRFSIRQVLEFGAQIAQIIKKIHQAGWVWNDCKPANLIVTTDGSLRPIDFEGAYPVNKFEPFDWKTEGFSKSAGVSKEPGGKSSDLYALGAVVYFLLTGAFYDAGNPTAIEKLRRNVPRKLIEITGRLLSDSYPDSAKVGKEFERLLDQFKIKFKG